MVKEDKATWKSNYFLKIAQLLDEYPKCFIVNADNVGSKQMQQIRAALRDSAVILMGKNTMMRKAVRGHLEKNPALERLLPYIKGNVGLVFLKGDLVEVRDKLKANKVQAPAKAGALAPLNVYVSSQATALGPEKTSFFQALQIPTKITRGCIEILNEVHLIKVGERVGASEATLLNMLNISPFSYGLLIQHVYDSGTLFEPEILDITDDDLRSKFMSGVRNIAAVCLAIGYPTAASAPHSIVNGFKRLLALAVETDITFPEAEQIKIIDMAEARVYAKRTDIVRISKRSIPQFDRDAYFNREECRIILIGKTGAGKSTTGNKILGKKVFEAKLCLQSITSKCQSGTAKIGDRTVLVVDTPGVCDTGMSKDMVTEEIAKCVGIAAPGPHAIILVARLGRFTQEERDVVQHFKTVFGDDMVKYLIVLWTGKDEMERCNVQLSEALQHAPPFLKDTLDECDNRVIAFSFENQSEVSELFDIIDQMISENGNRFYTCEYFREVEQKMRQIEEEMVRKKKEKQEEKKRKEEQVNKMEETIFQQRAENQRMKERQKQIEIKNMLEINKLKKGTEHQIKTMREMEEKHTAQRKEYEERRIRNEENVRRMEKDRDLQRNKVIEIQKRMLEEARGELRRKAEKKGFFSSIFAAVGSLPGKLLDTVFRTNKMLDSDAVLELL